VAELVFFSGTMDCGKSTLALQMDHNHSVRGRSGLIFTKHDRAGEAVLSSRLGLATTALEVVDGLDFWEVVVGRATSGQRVDYLICDEAQFYAPAQVEQLARLVDEMDVDVYAFGITADFRTALFPGSQRMIEPRSDASGRSAVLVWPPRHPECPGGRRRDGSGGRAGRGGGHRAG
jgi:thymidine kinase